MVCRLRTEWDDGMMPALGRLCIYTVSVTHRQQLGNAVHGHPSLVRGMLSMRSNTGPLALCYKSNVFCVGHHLFEVWKTLSSQGLTGEPGSIPRASHPRNKPQAGGTDLRQRGTDWAKSKHGHHPLRAVSEVTGPGYEVQCIMDGAWCLESLGWRMGRSSCAGYVCCVV